MKEPFDQVQSVILTEKATLLSEKHNQYVFRVSPKANKIEIKRAVEQLFKKTVLNVNTANFAGKKKRQRTASFGRRSHWKKAVITLKEGEKLDLI
jgi:large subunit ribosomal protein L23